LGIVVEQRGVGEEDGHTVAGQFVEHDHLVGVDPGETVRRQAPHGVDETGFRGVAHAVEPGTIKPSTGVTVIEELAHHVVTLSGSPLAQHRHLGADRPPGFLRLGRHPGVYGNSHRASSNMRAAPVGLASNNSNPAASASSLGST
jgi:hypothetical protein